MFESSNESRTSNPPYFSALLRDVSYIYDDKAVSNSVLLAISSRKQPSLSARRMWRTVRILTFDLLDLRSISKSEVLSKSGQF